MTLLVIHEENEPQTENPLRGVAYPLTALGPAAQKLADLLINQFAEGPYKRGAVLIRIMATVDIAMRHPEAFVVASDLA